MTKEEFLELVHKLNSDSLLERKQARRVILQTCIPIIEKWYYIWFEYGFSISKYDDYRVCCGEIVNVSYNDDVLTFHYITPGLEKDIHDFIYVGTEIIDEDFLEKKKEEGIIKAINRALDRLEHYKRAFKQTEEYIAKLRNKIVKEEDNIITYI